MLSRNSTLLSSPQPDLPPLQHPSTLALRGSTNQTNQNTAPDGNVSPRLPEKRQVAPPLPLLSSPRPSSLHRAASSISTPPSLSPLQEYHSGYSDVDVGSPYTPNQHRRQQSFPNLLPLSFRSRTPSPTRKLSFLSSEQQMPLTGDGRANGGGKATMASSKAGGGGFAGWLSSTAAGNALGMSSSPAIPSPASSRAANTTIDTQGTPSTADVTPTKLRRSTSSATAAGFDPSTPRSAVTTTASRFMSAISSRFNNNTQTSQNLDDIDDELCNLDVESALFPNDPSSPISDRDTFSPAAFKNLQTNAVGLLTRMQTAYRERVVSLRDMQAERSAQRDEMEEAETRAAHLKMQLEGMARKASEQEMVMRQLMEELASERRARAEEQHLVRRAAALQGMQQAGDKSPLSLLGVEEAASMVSEDLGVDEDRLRLRLGRERGGGWRKSSASGGGGGMVDDTDEESAESESVFSRCRSPGFVSPRVGSGEFSGNGSGMLVEHARNPPSHSVASSTRHQPPPPPQQQQQQQQQQQRAGGVSALQKIFRGISGEGAGDDATADCANCKGQDASVAWDTVGLLRDENRHLKQRVGQLEVAVEGALDLVNGIGM